MRYFTFLVAFFSIVEAFAGIYEPDLLWDKSNISVCFVVHPDQVKLTQWANDSSFRPEIFTAAEQEKIKRVINKNYSVESTGIHFTGWGECSDPVVSDVVIVKAGKVPRKFWFRKSVNFAGEASIGCRGVSEDGRVYAKDSVRKAGVVLTMTSPAVLVHEFGHLSGLRHEHTHPDYFDPIGILRESLGTAVVHVPYDYNSVMNSYVKRMVHDKDGCSNEECLSDGDRVTLKSIYSGRPEHAAGHILDP